MSQASKSSGDTVACMNEEGLVEIRDIYTGRVLAVQSSTGDALKSKKEKMQQVLLPDGSLLYLEPGIDQERYQAPRSPWAYSETLIDIICSKILDDGKSLTAICKEPGMPPFSVLARWRRKFPEVEEKIKQARADRAEVLREQVVDEAMAELYHRDVDGNLVLDASGKPVPITPSSEWIAQRKLRVGALQWAAGMDNPDRYGQKAKVAGDTKVTVQLLVDTGIRRPEDRDVTPKQPMQEIPGGNHQNEVEVLDSAADAGGSGDSSADSGTEHTGASDSD